MPQMYFAKFNINSNIYDVYNDDSIRQNILLDILTKINQKKTITEGKVEYKFCNLHVDLKEKYIAGRLVKIFLDEVQKYDPNIDDVNTSSEEEFAAAVNFYFDVDLEQIAFAIRNNFGYKQFIYYFKLLLEEYFDDLEFEIFLEQNADEFKNRVNELKKIYEVKLVMIPPNAPNKKEFQDLFGTNVEEIKETNSTKYTQVVQSSKKADAGINRDSNFFERGYYGISKGYAEMAVSGVDEDDTDQTIRSIQDTPHKRGIPRKDRDNINKIIEYGKKFIFELTQKKREVKFIGRKE